MLVTSSMDKSLTKFLLVLLLAVLTLSTSNAMKEIDTKNDVREDIKDLTYDELLPVVFNAAHALHKLKSYYKWWYRLTRAIIQKKTKLCLLPTEPRRRLCARIYISVFRDFQNAKVNDILRFLQEPKDCRKEMIRTPMDNGRRLWRSKKTMFFCQPFYYPVIVPTDYGSAVAWGQAPGIHVSAAHRKNAVFVFLRNSDNDNLEIFTYVENLTFEQEDVADKVSPVKTVSQPPNPVFQSLNSPIHQPKSRFKNEKS